MFVLAFLLTAGMVSGAVPTGAQTAVSTAGTTTPTATTAPTPSESSPSTATAVDTVTASTTTSSGTLTAATEAPSDTSTAASTADSATTETAADGTIDPDVVIEQWDDQIQVIVLIEDTPDSVEAFEVRGATMNRELQPSGSPPVGQGTLTKPATVEVIVVYEDGSESVIHTKTFE